MAKKKVSTTSPNKFWKKTAIALTVFFALAFIISSTYESIAKATLEKVATNALGVEVSIGSLDISPLSGAASVSNIEINNPEGYSNNPAIAIPYAHTSLQLKSIFSNTVMINEIFIDGMNVSYELQGKGSNLYVLEQRTKDRTTKPDPAPAADSVTTKKNVEISRLKMINLELQTNIAGMDAVTVEASDIELKNLGKDRELTIAEAIQIALGSVLKTSLKAASGISIKSGMEKILDGASEVGSGIGNSIKGLFE